MSVRIIQGDCRDVLRTLPDQSVNCVVTSPPYYGLRDYGTGRWEGGDPNCEHRSPTMRAGRNEERPKLAGSEATNSAQLLLAHRSACGKCGAVKIDKQIGLERTPDAFVAELVDVFREVRRVLRDDGTIWVNIGDTYQNAKGQSGGVDPKQPARRHGLRPQDVSLPGLKPKDLIGVPWMLAFALRADGWYLREDIIWNKPNAMPDPVGDRCTRSHEYVFHLSKSRIYYHDADAIKEPAVSNHPSGNGFERGARLSYQNADGSARGNQEQWTDIGGMRNKRSVWTVPTQPFPDAHFATFPHNLIEPCILAGCPSGGTILDPFGGAGTTGIVADRLHRSAVLIELNPEYAAMALARFERDAGMFMEVA